MLAHISGEELRRIVHKNLLVKALVTDLVRQECLACAFACIYFPALDSVWKAWWLELTQKTKITHIYSATLFLHTHGKWVWMWKCGWCLEGVVTGGKCSSGGVIVHNLFVIVLLAPTNNTLTTKYFTLFFWCL